MWWWRRLGSWGSCCGRCGRAREVQPSLLLRETDFAHQFGVTRIGARGISASHWKATRAAELEILGFEDHTHPAAAQLADNAVVRDGLADHVGQWRGDYEGKSLKGAELAVAQKRRMAGLDSSTFRE